jgi:hypothetical protein
MTDDIWVTITADEHDFEFEFGRVGSGEIILEAKLTPAQLLQIFQYSGLDFYEHPNTVDNE